MKFIKRFFLFLVIIILIILLYFIFNGYILYKETIDEKSIEDRIALIQNNENFTKISDVPDYYIKAIVSIEDHRFYSHGGVDIIATGRAVLNNIKSRRLAEGRKFNKSTSFKKFMFYSRKNHV